MHLLFSFSLEPLFHIFSYPFQWSVTSGCLLLMWVCTITNSIIFKAFAYFPININNLFHPPPNNIRPSATYQLSTKRQSHDGVTKMNQSSMLKLVKV